MKSSFEVTLCVRFSIRCERRCPKKLPLLHTGTVLHTVLLLSLHSLLLTTNYEEATRIHTKEKETDSELKAQTIYHKKTKADIILFAIFVSLYLSQPLSLSLLLLFS